MRPKAQQILTSFTCVLLIVTTAIALLSYRDKKNQAEALAEVASMMFSDEPDVRAGAIGAASRAFLDDRLPPVMFVQLMSRARTSSEEEVRRAISQGVWQVSQERGHENIYRDLMKRGRPFLDIRYPEGSDKETITKLIDVLRGETFAQGPFFIGSKAMHRVDKSELRCFVEQCDDDRLAKDLESYLRESNVDLSISNKSKILRLPLLYVNTIEIWLTVDNIKSFIASQERRSFKSAVLPKNKP